MKEARTDWQYGHDHDFGTGDLPNRTTVGQVSEPFFLTKIYPDILRRWNNRNNNMKEFDLTDLCAEVAASLVYKDPQDGQQAKYTEDQVRDVLEAAFSAIADALALAEGRVELHQFGVFALEPRSAHEWTLPDGSTVATPDRNKIDFRPSPAFIRRVAERTGMPAY